MSLPLEFQFRQSDILKSPVHVANRAREVRLEEVSKLVLTAARLVTKVILIAAQSSFRSLMFIWTCCQLKLTCAATRSEFPNMKIACGTSQNLLLTASRARSAISHSQSSCVRELLLAVRFECNQIWSALVSRDRRMSHGHNRSGKRLLRPTLYECMHTLLEEKLLPQRQNEAAPKQSAPQRDRGT